MKNAGVKESHGVPTEAKQSEIYYPSFSLNSKAVDEIRDFKIGDKVEMKIVAVIKGLREDYSDKKHICADVEVKELEVMNQTEDRKESKRLGLSMADYMEIKGKKK